MTTDFSIAYARATDDETTSSMEQLLVAIAFYHLEEPDRWSMHAVYAAKALAVARDRVDKLPSAAGRWTEILDRMESAVRRGRAIPGESHFFPAPMPLAEQLARLHRGK